MNKFPEGNAIIYCNKFFNTPDGKTAHGLVRFTRRYRILSVLDSNYAGKDAGEVLDDKPANIPIFSDLESALADANRKNLTVKFLVIGIAPEGGKLNHDARKTVKKAITQGLNVDSGLHDFLNEDAELAALAKKHNVVLRDVRKPPDRKQLHFFEGKIEQVKSIKIAVLGTDSAVGKRTTAWLLTQELNRRGRSAQFVGTGQTAWLQGADYCLLLDSLINDFVSGEIEHAVWSAWHDYRPDFIIIEGQGSLMNPAFPGGFEILAAARPEAIILQHAPARKDYDGFPGYPVHPIDRQIQAIELISGRPVVAVTLNHENMSKEGIEKIATELSERLNLPVFDVLWQGAAGLAEAVEKIRKK